MPETWKSFKDFVEAQIAEGPALLYRGQSNPKWGLTSSFHRLAAAIPRATYWDLMYTVHDYVSTWTNRAWNLRDSFDYASFLGFLQHHGFPTPLLDWTRSPYTAAYFAFDGVDDKVPQSDEVAIFAFDAQRWHEHWHPVLNINDDAAHVSVLNSQFRGNQRQLLQQGVYTYSTVEDQEQHIRFLENERSKQDEKPTTYLRRFQISVREKPRVMQELRLMGISSMTLFPSVEGVCKHLRDMLFPIQTIGQTPADRTAALVRALQAVKTEAPAGANAESKEDLPQIADG